jgi:predicted nucleotidyltransferase component of viral defense system
MSLAAERLTRLSAETGFRAETLEKVDRLIGILDDVTRHPRLSGALALKGGTALNLGFGAPARLSVDLDFNYIGAADRGKLEGERPQAEQAVETIAGGQGFSVQRSADAHAGRKLYLGYRSVFGSNDRLEVDINYQYRIPLVRPVRMRLWRPEGGRSRPCLVVGMEELCAGKLCALVDRALPRDCYDAIRLPDIAGRSWGLRLRRLFVTIAGALPRPLYTYDRERLRSVTQATVESQLHPMLVGGDRPSARALRQGAFAVVGPLLRLTAAEREFSRRIQEGDLRPGLLFPRNAPMSTRLRSHPVLLWKVENARTRRQR